MKRFDGRPIDVDVLRRMANRLVHRGPDGEGYLVRGSVGLGHRRLAVIDVDGSRQPMSSHDDSLHVSFNGEILNYQELRSRTPYPYRTRGDTEVLLSLFERRGAASIDLLEGQFAYALYDQSDDALWLFRDRLGILPLYYYYDSEHFLFASEVKGILAALPGRPEVDLASMDEYLARRSVQAPWTLFKGIYKLPAGTSLCVRDAPEVELKRYWRPAPSTGGRVFGSAEEARIGLDRRLREAVARNLVADVPVGAYLSGGIDSSLIVALMRSVAPEAEIQTFAASFGDVGVNELPFAGLVSNLVNTVHHEVRVDPSDLEEAWPVLAWHRDAPVSEASDVAVHRLAGMASGHVKVVLSGEGSDEIFAGYPKHRLAGATRHIGLIPASLRSTLLGAAERRLPPALGRPRIALRALSAADYADRIEGWFAPFTPADRRALLRGIRSRPRDVAELGRGVGALDEMLLADMLAWLPDNLLERGDRMTMSYSVELRPPFLDRQLVEWALGLPIHLKLRRRVGKWILREVARNYLPQEIVSRPKVGFRVPIDDWFRGHMREFVREALLSSDSFVASVLDRPTVEHLVRRHMLGQASEELRIWTLLSLEVWHRVFFRGALPVRCATAQLRERVTVTR